MMIAVSAGRAELLDAWSWPPAVVSGIALSATFYLLGWRARRRSQRRFSSTLRVPRRTTVQAWLRAAAFGAGCVVLVVALLSPLDAAADQLFWVHMVQHELLMTVAAPLFVIARPIPVLLWAIPRSWRRAVAGDAWLSRRGRAAMRWATRPFDAWLIHGAAIWLWHVPLLFQAALANDAVHALQHACFFGSGLLFWSAVLHPRRRADWGISILSLFTTALHTAVLGALLAVSRAPWYPMYAAREASRGVAPLVDQQIAGLVMWIPVGVIYLAAALVLLARWLDASARRADYGEYAARPGVARTEPLGLAS